MSNLPNINVHDHPLLKHKLGYLRDQTTYSHEFRELTKEISRILAYEVMKDWTDMEKVSIQTPIAKATIERIVNAPVVVSIMRAGNGMLDAVQRVEQRCARLFHVALERPKFVGIAQVFFDHVIVLRHRAIKLLSVFDEHDAL